MEKIREIIAYKNYFEDFLKEQPIKVQNKIFKILEGDFRENPNKLPQTHCWNKRTLRSKNPIRVRHLARFLFFRQRKISNLTKWISEKDTENA
jgi:hypothetical protein